MKFDVNKLLELLAEYLKYSSADGVPKRRELRAQMKQMLGVDLDPHEK